MFFGTTVEVLNITAWNNFGCLSVTEFILRNAVDFVKVRRRKLDRLTVWSSTVLFNFPRLCSLSPRVACVMLYFLSLLEMEKKVQCSTERLSVTEKPLTA